MPERTITTDQAGTGAVLGVARWRARPHDHRQLVQHDRRVLDEHRVGKIGRRFDSDNRAAGLLERALYARCCARATAMSMGVRSRCVSSHWTIAALYFASRGDQHLVIGHLVI